MVQKYLSRRRYTNKRLFKANKSRRRQKGGETYSISEFDEGLFDIIFAKFKQKLDLSDKENPPVAVRGLREFCVGYEDHHEGKNEKLCDKDVFFNYDDFLDEKNLDKFERLYTPGFRNDMLKIGEIIDDNTYDDDIIKYSLITKVFNKRSCRVSDYGNRLKGHIINIFRLLCHNRNILKTKLDTLIDGVLQHIKNCDASNFEGLRTKDVVLKDALNPLISLLTGSDKHNADQEKAKLARDLSYQVRDSIMAFKMLSENSYVSKHEFINSVNENKNSIYWVARPAQIAIIGATITSGMNLYSSQIYKGDTDTFSNYMDHISSNIEIKEDISQHFFNITSELSTAFLKTCTPLLGSILSIAGHAAISAIANTDFMKQQTSHRKEYIKFNSVFEKSTDDKAEKCSFFKNKDQYIENFKNASILIMNYENACAHHYDKYLPKLKYYLNAYMIICKESLAEIKDSEIPQATTETNLTMEKLESLMRSPNFIDDGGLKSRFNALTEKQKTDFIHIFIEKKYKVPSSLTDTTKYTFKQNFEACLLDVVDSML
jgi:hypothetical protein